MKSFWESALLDVLHASWCRAACAVTLFSLSGAALAGSPPPAPAAAATPACAKPTRLAELEGALAASEEAFKDLDEKKMATDLARARELLGCLGEIIPPAVAARVHRDHGLLASLTGKEEDQIPSFAAAADADPAYQFPADVLGQGNPTAVLYKTASALEPLLKPVTAPPASKLYWDGRSGTQRPTNRPVVFQIARTSTEVAVTALVQPDQSLPGVPAPAPLASTATPPKGHPKENTKPPKGEGEKKGKGKVVKVALIAGGGGLVVASAVAGVDAWLIGQNFNTTYYGEDARQVTNEDHVLTDDQISAFHQDIDAEVQRQKMFAGASVGAGVLGVTALTLGFVVKW